MFYRVVMQGRALGGADVDDVKRDFIRVTGLPPGVAEQLFGGMPQIIKRQVPQPDAERIAATLRAIGAAATVERETAGAEEGSPSGFQVMATPLNGGPPTVIPGMVPLPGSTPPASRHARWLRTVRNNWPMLRGGALLVAGVILFAPFADDLVNSLRPAQPPARVVPKRAPAPASAPSLLVLNASLMQGPWRCTNQSTGVSTYWTYGAEGAVIFHGDVLSDRPPRAEVAAAGPTGWAIAGQRLVHTFAHRAPDSYKVVDMSLSRLRYGDERGYEIECRRP
ncbi:MAG: hypothetical protein ABI624_08645 [Casimicrobiaceae bacterium]